MGSCSGNVCWYCERLCFRETDGGGKSPTIDHFKPLRHFPELAYNWRNWIFSCHRCNVDNKGGEWPSLGYVDPSAPDEQDRPEEYFDYDAATGEIIPIASLAQETRMKALRTIDDLGLNKVDVRFYRLQWTRRFVEDWTAMPTEDRHAFAQYCARSGVEFGGATLMVVQQLQMSEEV